MILVQTYFEDYSKCRHELAHNFVQEDKIYNIKDQFSMQSGYVSIILHLHLSYRRKTIYNRYRRYLQEIIKYLC